MKSVKVSHLDLGATRRSMGLLRATPTTPTIGERDLLSCWLLSHGRWARAASAMAMKPICAADRAQKALRKCCS